MVAKKNRHKSGRAQATPLEKAKPTLLQLGKEPSKKTLQRAKKAAEKAARMKKDEEFRKKEAMDPADLENAMEE